MKIQCRVTDWEPRFAEMFFDNPLNDCRQCLPSLGQHKIFRSLRPVQLEAGGKGGDPNLARRGVGRNHKFAWRLVEQDIEHAILFFHFKPTLFLGLDETLLKGLHRSIAVAAECSLV